MTYQLEWAWCSTCQALHYAGFEGPYKGNCSGSDSEHAQQASPHYAVEYAIAARDRMQQDWASCAKCRVLYYAGFAGHPGACAAGGEHSQEGSFNYAVPFDTTEDGLEQSWASCPKCRCLHWAGQDARGACPGGGRHETTGSFAYGVHRMPNQAAVRWTGLECRIKQESGDDADEIFGGLALVTADGVGSFTHTFPDNGPYWNLGAEGKRIVAGDISLYSGPAKGLAVTVSLTEWDFDEDTLAKYREFLTKAGSEAAAKAADYYVPGSGEVAKPVLEDLTGRIIDFGVKVLGLENDPYPPATLSFTEADLTGSPYDRRLLTRGDDARRVSWTHLVEVSGTDDGGDRGVYAFYFIIDRMAPVPVWQREKPYRKPDFRAEAQVNVKLPGGRAGWSETIKAGRRLP
ncbi:MAG: hypothetical protein ABWX96_12080 [Propionibacteriaceae bacterium]